ncbi:MAG: phytoene/squalene synthase family protein [Ignavibacteria bacterium]
MLELYNKISEKTSKLITNSYSTSFSIGIRLLHKSLRQPIYQIYGFVRIADEIVDTFHNFDKEKLLSDFKIETFKAINEHISTNPVLNSFQSVVHKYNIDTELIETFFYSMNLDLTKRTYIYEEFKQYIRGSAEAVGLMCLKVFVKGDIIEYNRLMPYAAALGSAFQKVNFLRDIKADYYKLGRVYFPQLNIDLRDKTSKKAIEDDIEKDFDTALKGINLLPRTAKLGVLVAYNYYLSLFKKIKKMDFSTLLRKRPRVPDFIKYLILLKTFVILKFAFKK